MIRILVKFVTLIELVKALFGKSLRTVYKVLGLTVIEVKIEAVLNLN
jgi:hypothetical protein